MVDEKRIAELSERIIQEFHPEKIILFGSYMNGTVKEWNCFFQRAVLQVNE